MADPGTAPSLHLTGATGFLGSELARLRPDATSERVKVRDARAVSSLLRRLRPDLVIHTAYLQQGDGAWETTVDGAANVARAARSSSATMTSRRRLDGAKGVRFSRVCRRAPERVTPAALT